MADVNRSLPPDVRAKTVYNRTKLVDATIGTVEKNLGRGRDPRRSWSCS